MKFRLDPEFIDASVRKYKVGSVAFVSLGALIFGLMWAGGLEIPLVFPVGFALASVWIVWQNIGRARRLKEELPHVSVDLAITEAVIAISDAQMSLPYASMQEIMVKQRRGEIVWIDITTGKGRIARLEGLVGMERLLAQLRKLAPKATLRELRWFHLHAGGA